MPKIIIEQPNGSLHHRASGFWAQGPGEYDFPDDPAFAGFLAGHCERGTCRMVEPVAVAPAVEPDAVKASEAAGEDAKPVQKAEAAVEPEPAPDLPDGLKPGSPDKVAIQTHGQSAAVRQNTSASAAAVVANLPHAPRKG